MRVYVQKENGEFIDESAFSVFYGFTSLGYKVISFDEVAPSDRKKRDVVYGKIGAVHSALHDMNVEIPDNLIIPDELKFFLGRKTDECSLKDLKQSPIDFPIFIKPLRVNKLFHGTIVSSQPELDFLNDFSDDTMLFTSEVIDIVSEYRCFVFRRELVGCKHYKGNFTRLPNFDLICDAIKRIVNPIVAYSIDFGVTYNNETLVIELNDMYSLRSYGLPAKLFCEMIRCRWNEITSTNRKHIHYGNNTQIGKR